MLGVGCSSGAGSRVQSAKCHIRGILSRAGSGVSTLPIGQPEGLALNSRIFPDTQFSGTPIEEQGMAGVESQPSYGSVFNYRETEHTKTPLMGG